MTTSKHKEVDAREEKKFDFLANLRVGTKVRYNDTNWIYIGAHRGSPTGLVNVVLVDEVAPRGAYLSYISPTTEVEILQKTK